jgi:hypothetical protein
MMPTVTLCVSSPSLPGYSRVEVHPLLATESVSTCHRDEYSLMYS